MEDKARGCKRLCENIDSLSKEMRSEMLAVIDDYTALIKAHIFMSMDKDDDGTEHDSE